MEEIIKKIDKLSREIINFIIDNRLSYTPITKFYDGERTIFTTYISKDIPNSTSLILTSSNIEIDHYKDGISLPLDITRDKLAEVYNQLEKDYNKWKINNLEKVKAEVVKKKREQKEELERQLLQIKNELNEL